MGPRMSGTTRKNWRNGFAGGEQPDVAPSRHADHDLRQDRPLPRVGTWWVGGHSHYGRKWPLTGDDSPPVTTVAAPCPQGPLLGLELNGSSRGTLDKVPLQENKGYDERCRSDNHACRQQGPVALVTSVKSE